MIDSINILGPRRFVLSRKPAIYLLFALIAAGPFLFMGLQGRAQTTPTPPVEPPLGLTIEGPKTSQFTGSKIKLYIQGSSKNVKVIATSLPSSAKFGYFSYDGDVSSRSSAIVEWIPTADGTFKFDFAATNSRGEKVTKGFPVTVIATSENGEWTQIVLPDRRQIIQALVSGSTIYAATRADDIIGSNRFDAIFRSMDNGRSWIKIGKGLPTNSPLWGRLVNSGKALYATLDAGMYRSTDAGENWTEIGAGKGLPGDGKGIFNLAAGDDRVLAATSEKIFLSLDSGETWKETTNNLLVRPNRVGALGVMGNVLLASIFTPNLVGGPIAYRSINNGANWLPSDWPNAEPMLHFLVNEDGLYGMTRIGFFYSPAQGMSWQHLNPQIFTASAARFRTADQGVSLQSPLHPEIQPIISVAAGRGILLIMYVYAGIYISRDRGQTWCPFNQGLSEFPPDNSYAVATNNTHSFLVTADGKLLSRPH